MDIASFKAKLSSGGMQKSSHYQVEFFPPSGVGQIPYGNATAHCYVKDVSLPGRNIATSEIKYGGLPTTKQAYSSIPNDCTVTFMADGNIRMDFQNGNAFFDISSQPTGSQFRTMSKIIDLANSVEVNSRDGIGEYDDRRETYSNENSSRESFDDIPHPEAVIGKIRSFFQKDVYPSQFAKFLSSNNWYKAAQNGPSDRLWLSCRQ